MKNFEARLLKLEQAATADVMRVTWRISKRTDNNMNWSDAVVVYIDGVRQGPAPAPRAEASL